jgi:hypothetical protein
MSKLSLRSLHPTDVRGTALITVTNVTGERMSKENRPTQGPKFRSRVFEEYLSRQSPERFAEIVRGEAAYGELITSEHSLKRSAERQLEECMVGLEEKPAGTKTATDIDVAHDYVPVYGSNGWRGDGT